MQEQKWPEQRFIEFLVRLTGAAEERERSAKERAILAQLRQGLGKPPGSVWSMYPFVEPFLQGCSEATTRDAYYCVASLFAYHPMVWPTPDASQENKEVTHFGASVALLMKALRQDGASTDSLERRFVALLNARGEDLPDHLRRIVALLKSRGIPVNWSRLLRDYLWWDQESRSVQRSWARSVWRESTESTRNQEGVAGHDA